MNKQPVDTQGTIDHVEANPKTETVDLTGAYQSAPSTEPIFPASPADAPVIPGYIITGEIAKGGMGRVYSGRELSLDREVAIKTLLPGANAERFVTESKITAKLPHPNIPPVHALGTLADGSPYLAMKLIRGRTLAAELKARPDLKHDLSRFVQIFEQIAQAVGFAHAQGIIHRDLKPANVMVGAFGEVQVMDWGLAKDLRNSTNPERESADSCDNPEMTQAGTIMGTPAYMAPEQARGEAVDTRADVFALGGILIAILTGRAIFTGKTSRETIQRAASGDTVETIARLAASEVDSELIGIAHQCLAVNQAERPADGRTVAALVAEYRLGVETRLRQAETDRAAAVVRDGEQRKRRRVLASSAAAVLVVSVIGTAVSVWKANEANTAARSEAAQKVIADEKANAATRAEAATAAQLVKTQAAEAAAQEETKKTQAALVVANERTKSLGAAYSDFVFGIQNKLENRPGTQDLRRELLETARKGLAKILDDARKQGTPDRTLWGAHMQMGDVELNLGNTLAAKKEFDAGHEIARALTYADPKNADAQRNLSFSYINLGDVTLQLGNTKDALGFYQKSGKILQTLADADPKNAQAQRNLSISYNKLGNVTLQLGNTKDALDFYQKSGKILQTLADADPKNTQAQRDLSVSYIKLGDVTLKLGNTQDALDFYQKSLKVRQTLVDADPKNTQAQRDLGVSYYKLGDVTLQLGNTQDALDFYQKSLKVSQTLADADPKNADAQRDLSISYNKLGNVTLQLGNTKDALDFYQKSGKILQTLSDADPKNADVRRDLLVSFYKFGTVAQKIEDYTAAIGWYEKAIAVATKFEKPQFFANEAKEIKKQIGDCKAKMASQKRRETAPPPRAAK